MQIKHPEWLHVKLDDQQLYGYNQSWYATSFQKTRGCGPTAAAMLIAYLNRREADPLPYKSHSISSITQVLESIWNFITPGWLLGLNSTEKFCQGINKLFSHYGLIWRCHRLRVTASKSNRVSLSQVVEFLAAGIASDCPIAFLNLHRGQETVLESWHWVVLVALSYEDSKRRFIATCYDGGASITVDLGHWLETTRLGGGFVYISNGTT